ncbi:MAG TPA: hypothetical protein VND15_04045 [Candidatus Acidoferrales bacterium]|nr:hypothetical protein [Candidatus Acidoferrales bacterium]
MAKTPVLEYAIETYRANLKLILLFSISFVIAFLIPVFASFPTFIDAGSIFLRTASVFLNLNIFNTAIIFAAVFFSLLFLSFAIVAINVIVKHSRTHTRITREVMGGIEKYTGKVFAVLLISTVIVLLASLVTYGSPYSALITAIVGLIITPFVFYAPASIVIDDNRIGHAIDASLSFFFKRFDYFLMWLVFAIVLLTVFDFVFILVGGTVASRYIMLVFNSLFIIPFLVLLQSELYMSRFKLLKR